MIDTFLKPISDEVVEFAKKLPKSTIGREMILHTSEEFPTLSEGAVALLTIGDARMCHTESTTIDYSHARKNLYQLYKGNWDVKLIDLGILDKGDTVEDTFYALKEIQWELLKQKVPLIVIGASQEFVYPLYRAYDRFEQQVNLVTINEKIELFLPEGQTNYLSKIILEEPHNLQNYSNIGYQTYFNSQEEINLVEQLFFDAHRLGEVAEDIRKVEPIMRDADMLAISMRAVKSSDIGYYHYFQPNGFDGREICTLARYGGISEKIKTYAILDIESLQTKSQLLSQMIWYIVEGINYRISEYPFQPKDDYYKYIVPQEDQELVFYKSDQTGRWWIEIEHYIGGTKKKTLFPCSESDYHKAIENETPERWWKALQKLSL